MDNLFQKDISLFANQMLVLNFLHSAKEGNFINWKRLVQKNVFPKILMVDCFEKNFRNMKNVLEVCIQPSTQFCRQAR